MQPNFEQETPQIISPKDALIILKCGKTWLYSQVKTNPNFPKLVRLSIRKTGFRKDELISYINSL